MITSVNYVGFFFPQICPVLQRWCIWIQKVLVLSNRALTFNRYLGDFEYSTCCRITWKERKREMERQEESETQF